LREFHDMVLSPGQVPLDLVEELVDKRIQQHMAAQFS
jgi:uncharacterized protein (DUF885 family)